MWGVKVLTSGIILLSVGLVLADEKPRPAESPKRFESARLLKLFDRNKDGCLDRSEVPERIKARFDQLDTNKDGQLDSAELDKAPARPGRPAGKPGEIITPAAKGERKTDRLRVGDAAPDFTLPRLSGKDGVTLSAYQGKRPVVLIFASYT